MKKTNRKGFTIVELVIVIAVIAILAAVLIPTFASLVKKANQSADIQAVKEMNTALSIYFAENDTPTTIAELRTALSECGINADVAPVTQGYAFYWNKTTKKIELISIDELKADTNIIKDSILLSSCDFGTLESVSDANTLKSKIEDATSDTPTLIKLTNDITVEEEIEVEGNIIIDLNNQNITQAENAAGADYGNAILSVKTGGVLTVKNGTLSGDRAINCLNGGHLTLDGVKFDGGGHNYTKGNAKVSTTSIYAVGLSDVTIVNCEFNTDNYYALSANSKDNSSDGTRWHIENTKAKAASMGIYMPTRCYMVIKDCEFKGGDVGADFLGCDATLVDSTFVTEGTEVQGIGSFETPVKKISPVGIIFACGDGNGWAATATFKCTNVKGSYVITEQLAGGVKLIGTPVAAN